MILLDISVSTLTNVYFIFEYSLLYLNCRHGNINLHQCEQLNKLASPPTGMSEIIFNTHQPSSFYIHRSDEPHRCKQVGLVQHCTCTPNAVTSIVCFLPLLYKFHMKRQLIDGISSHIYVTYFTYFVTTKLWKPLYNFLLILPVHIYKFSKIINIWR